MIDINRLTRLVILGDATAYDAWRRELERRGMWWCAGHAHKVWTLDEATEWFLSMYPSTRHGWAVHDADHQVVAVVFVWRATGSTAAHIFIGEDGCVDVTPWMEGKGISRTTSPYAPLLADTARTKCYRIWGDIRTGNHH